MDNWILKIVAPALISLICTSAATWKLIIKKSDPGGFIINITYFTFFESFALNPFNVSDFRAELNRFSESDIFLGLVLTYSLPILLFISIGLWRRVLSGASNRFSNFSWRGVNKSSFEKCLLITYVALLCAVALPNIIWGGFFVSAFRQVMMGYSIGDDGGEAFQGAAGAGVSLISLQNISPSALILALLLLKTRHRVFALCTLPLCFLWSAPTLLGGTRSYFVGLIIVGLFCLLTDPRVRLKGLLYVGMCGIVIAAFAGAIVQFRTGGWQSLSTESIDRGAMTKFQGNECIIYHIEAISFHKTGYVSPWQNGNPIVDLGLGLLYLPADALLIWVPRSLFPWKPLDPSWEPYNAKTWAWQTGLSEATWTRTYSAGFLGRDIIRWGAAGFLVPVFWFGLFLWSAEQLYRYGEGHLVHRIIVGIMGGTFLVLMRDVNFMWFLPMMPAAFALLFSIRMAKATSEGVRPARRPRHWERPIRMARPVRY